MKKHTTLIAVAILTLTCSSCYRNAVYVGDFTPGEPKVEVKEQWNDLFFYGTVGSDADHYTQSFSRQHPSYMVETKLGLWNLLAGGLTLGIYSPTTTVYYIPSRDAEELNKR